MCISLIISDVECLFYIPVCHLYVVFWEMSVQIICPSFDQVNIFSIQLFKRLIYSLLIPCQRSSLQIFFLILWVVSSLSCLYPLLGRSFLTQMWFHLPVFVLVACARGVLLKKPLPDQCPEDFPKSFSCGNFIVWGLRFKFLTTLI